jgi:multiple sugar transport system substrate-binding protein
LAVAAARAPTTPLTRTLPPSRERRALIASALLATSAGLRAAPAPAVLTVAAFPLVDKIVEAALPIWRQRHPAVEVRITSRQYNDHHTAMTTALSTAVRLPDVMALEVSYVGRFAQGFGLDDLARPPYDIARFRPRWVPSAYDQATNRRGEVVAAPADIGPGTMLYREDILARAGVAIDDLTRSWASYVEAGQRIKAQTGAYLVAHVSQVKDIVIRTGLKPGEGLYFDRDSRVLVNSPRFVRAFEIARELRHRKLDARLSAWSNEWAEGLKRGTLCTELGGAWLVGQLNNWIAPDTRGRWRASQFPEGAFASYGGSFYAIPRQSNPATKSLAWEFIQLMTLDRTVQFGAFKGFDAFPTLLETHDDPFFDEPLPFLGGQKARLLWREATRHITATAVHKQNSFADEVIGTELDKVLERGKDIASALGDAERLLQRRANR